MFAEARCTTGNWFEAHNKEDLSLTGRQRKRGDRDGRANGPTQVTRWQDPACVSTVRVACSRVLSALKVMTLSPIHPVNTMCILGEKKSNSTLGAEVEIVGGSEPGFSRRWYISKIEKKRKTNEKRRKKINVERVDGDGLKQ
ncbi:hypothetical protein K0M31_018973 [Melipona bicolor]|uniref:Uncharacterized protein n=1 Tax=Melipona bicolor TaxID=60889 RepID=A0AA40KDV0_9HYME|nr:hypothetical protein K0M31_018973 [Melipona bicolor]